MKRKKIWIPIIPALIIFAAVLVLYPLYLTPLYQKEIIKEAQEHSINISNYFIKRYIPANIHFLNVNFFKEKGGSLLEDTAMFHIWKIRFFDAKGRIVYSTIQDEINTVNKKSYFKNKIAKGHTLSKIEKKGGKTLGGTQNVPTDVVETYIPIMRGKKFIGAFEIYLVVTAQMGRLYDIFYRSYMLIVLIIIPMVGFIIYSSRKIDKADYKMQMTNRELERLSNVDGLTELFNRRYFDRTLLKEIKRLQRTSHPISLLMCDIDYFKKYNDRYGHLAGDRCIQAVASLIQRHCKRSSDVSARYGGEEFCVILPQTRPSEALKLAQAIRSSLAKEMIPHQSSPLNGLVTISVGVVSLIPDLKTTPSKIIALADEALYQSKNMGRDTITLKDMMQPT